MTLKELFSEWTDGDVAQYYLACQPRLMAYDGSKANEWSATFDEVKGVFNTNNTFSKMTYAMLEELVEGGILETNDDVQFRWNKSFEESWKYQQFQ
jgi:hypothetical protein